jgi:hypothetical protein
MSGFNFVGNLPPAGGPGGTPDKFFRATKVVAPEIIADNTVTTITFDSEDYDHGGIYAPSTFNAPDDGLYLLESTVEIVFQAAGYRRVWFDVAGVGTVAEDRLPVAGVETQIVNLTSLIHLAKNRLVQVKIFQLTGMTATIPITSSHYNGAQLRQGPL